MVKDVVIIADLGAAGNLLRNILLTSNQVDWPISDDRIKSILSQYDKVELKNWFNIEYRLRFWKKFYGTDLSDDIDIKEFHNRKRPVKPVVYLNHSAFYQYNEFQLLKSEVNILYIAPVTDFGLDWQIRSYCEKKSVEKMHNFTFVDNIDQRKEKYCNDYGKEAYYRLNIKNFKEIVGSRQKLFGKPDIALETILFGNIDLLLKNILEHTGIVVDFKQATQIISAWHSLHWPIDQTNNWKYHD